MENNLVLFKIAKDFRNLDNQSVIKTAGIVQRLRSWYNSLFDPEYKQNVQNMRQESKSVKMYLNQLSKYIDKYEASVSNGNIDSYNFSVDKIKEITSELIKIMSSYRETAEKAEAPANTTSSEPSLSEINKVYFTDKMKSSERVINTIAKAIMDSGYDKLKSETIARDPLTFLAIEEAITKGQVIGSEIALPSKETPNRAGELWVYIQTQPFKLPNEDISLQLEVVVTDLSQRENNPRPLMAVKSISSIKARKTANKKNNIVKKASDTLLAINGLEAKSSDFKRRLIEVANNVSIKPEYLAAVMASESGMKASATNPMGGAVGLIQFMPACVSIDTEILTLDGWKFYNQVTIGDEIISFNEKENTLEKDKITKLYEFDSVSTYRMHNKQFDFISTHDHRWYCDYNGKTVVKTTEELASLNSRYKIKRSALFKGDYSIELSEEFFELLGVIVGDGSINKTYFSENKKAGLTICQSIKAKPQVVDRIQFCLDKVFGHGKYLYSNCLRGMIRWHIRHEDASLFYKFLNEEKVLNKRLLFKLSPMQLKSLKKGYLIKDGTIQYGKYENFVQCHDERMRDFQLICFLLGETANVKEYIRKVSKQKIPNGKEYTIKPIKYYCNVKKRSSLTEARKCRMNYDKIIDLVKVWCPQTNNKTWIARRNGYITITGNTAERFGTSSDELRAMSDVQQLDYVEKFYSPYKGRLNTIGDVYMATFLPKFVGKPEDTIIAQKDNMDFVSKSEGLTYDKVYRYNKGFDYDKDGIIRISDVSNKVKNIYSAALKREPISVNEEPMANEDSELKELASYLGISLAKPLTNIVKNAILEKKIPKNTVVISLESDDISGTMAYSYVLSNALEAGIDADTKLYSKDNNIEIVCTANGSLDNIKSAIKGILNIINHQFIKRHSFVVENNFINKVSSNNEIKYSDLLKGKRKFALKGELREKS